MTNPRVASTVTVTFLTSVASLGLYTYIGVLVQQLARSHVATPYLWVWGIGGMAGSLFVGPLIDWARRPGVLMAGILATLAFSLFALPGSLHIPFLCFLPFTVWGAMGWASQAPQQHVLLRLQPHNGSASMALNSSANYLGSAVGSAIAGLLMSSGLPTSHLPIVAGCVVSVACLGQVRIVSLSNRQITKLGY
ncbi:MFS transporter [Alicyclobacillus dauci]|uniref:Major Facilitator Superfamily protein n=1 Tax=Alicyclobacillus dauci TaxID=1475485 RepID=A0ABY6Z5I9_9BACL|nr:hypothetical protein [Alicyclobacillus dauci]WAH37466.1 hypothetical protein NZD86_02695 [Alicyclobacillus dauci]